MTWRFTT